MNINNLTGKIASKADLIGKLYGYAGPMAGLYPSDPVAGIIAEHEQALSALLSGKLPKLENIISQLKNPATKNVIKNAIIAYLVGEVGGGFIGSRNATALKKFGSEAVKWSVLSAAVVSWDWNPHPPANLGLGIGASGNSPSWRYQA